MVHSKFAVKLHGWPLSTAAIRISATSISGFCRMAVLVSQLIIEQENYGFQDLLVAG